MSIAQPSWLRWIAAGFLLGLALAFVSRAAPAFMDAYLEASRARFDLMASAPPGEARYLIGFSDFDTLAEIARSEPDIRGVDHGNFAGIGRVTFSRSDSPAIEMLRQHPNTAVLLRTTIPLICH